MKMSICEVCAASLAWMSLSAVAEAAVTNVTSELELLGNPTLERWASPILANSVLDLQVHDGKVFMGTGDWSSNKGPIPVWAYDPEKGAFTNEFTAGTDAIEILRVLSDGRLYVPATDPRESHENRGSLFRRELDGRWTVFPDYGAATLPASSRTSGDKLCTHLWDAEMASNRLFMTGYGIAMSPDFGVSWSAVDNFYPYSERISSLIRCGDVLFARGERSVYFSGTSDKSGTTEYCTYSPAAGRAVMWRWNESTGVFETFTNTWANITPGLVHKDTALIYGLPNKYASASNRFWHPTPFGKRNLYVVGQENVNGDYGYPVGTRPMMAVTACAVEDGDGKKALKGERISLPSGYYPIDFCVSGAAAYLLAFSYNGADQNVRHGVWKTTDGVNFKQIMTFDYQQVIMSLEYLNGYFYFGVAHKKAQEPLGTLKSGITERAGSVYRVFLPQDGEVNDPNQLLNLPPAPKGGRFTRPTDLVWPANVGEADVCLWADDKVAACSVTIDDNCKPDHDWWIAIAKEYGIRLTWFLITNKIGGSNAGFDGTWSDWQRVANAGHSVQSHTTNHKSEKFARKTDPDFQLSEDDLIHMYRDSLAVINENLTNNFACTIAYPRGEAHTNVASRYAIACRGTVGRASIVNQIDYLTTDIGGGEPYFVDMIVYGATTNTAPSWVPSKSSWKRGWLIPLSHAVNARTPGNDTLVSWERNIRYMGAHKDDLWFGSFDDVAKYGQERDSATLTVTENAANRIRFTLTDTMCDAVFTFPLTVKVRVPNAWEHVAATQGVHGVAARLVEHEGSKYALVKAVPDRGAVTLISSDVEVPPPGDDPEVPGDDPDVPGDDPDVPGDDPGDEPDPVTPPDDPTPSEPVPAGMIPIGTVEEFVEKVVAEPSSNYVLTADLTFNKLAAIPTFSGLLDGAGHKITGLSAGLVTELTGTIKGLTIDGIDYQHKRIDYKNCDPFGFFAATVNGGSVKQCTLANCTLTQDRYASANAGVGGIVGNIGTNGGVVAGCKVLGCSVGSKFTSGTMTYGGIVGRSLATAEGSAVVSDCSVVSEPNAETTVKGFLVGGIVGGIAVNGHVRIERCLFDATIDGGDNLGGILGPCIGANGDKSVVDVLNCTNAANISVSCPAGGIVAGSYKGGLFRISGCVNRGNISTTVNKDSLSDNTGNGTGGIMGGHYGQSTVSGIVIDRCANYGAISAVTNVAGGLVGFFHRGNYSPVFVISNSVNHADVRSSHYTGGLVGYASYVAAGSLFVNCRQSGSVSSDGAKPAGGIVGCVRGGSKITYRISNVCQSGMVTATDGAASPVCGEISVGDKNSFKLYLDSVQIGGSATSERGTVGSIGGSTTVAASTGALTVVADAASYFAHHAGTSYYDQTGAAQTLSLNKLPADAMTDGTAKRRLNAFAKERGLPRWVQGRTGPELGLFSSGVTFVISVF